MFKINKIFNLLIIIIFLITAGPSHAQSKTKNNSSTFLNILDYKADNTGKEKVTDLIKKAIDDASEAGGGTIYFPAGEYLTGPIHFKSNITIYLEAGSILKFTDDYDDYLPMIKYRWEGTVGMNFSPQLYAYRVENIAIRGRGLIEGQGKKWWDYNNIVRDASKNGKEVPWTKYQQMHKDLNKDVKAPDTDQWQSGHFLRPPMFQAFESKNILIEGVSIQNPPFWTINPAFCENITITGITITNPHDSPNTDGINPSSCSYVRISDCHISVGDDCITIKSGRDRDGRDWGKACQNITITNCTMLSGHGGVVIGSEMSGDVRKVTISNCVFDGTDRGIRIKTMRGRGGIVEEIRVDNIVMKDIRLEAIKLNMKYKKSEEEPISERTPQFRNIHFSNITATEVNRAVALIGLEERWIDNVTFNDINMSAKTGFEIERSKNIELHNITIDVEKGPVVKAALVENLELEGIKTLNPLSGVPLIELENVINSYIYNCNPLPGTEQFLKVGGTDTKDIVIGSNNLIHVKEVVKEVDDLPAGAIIK